MAYQSPTPADIGIPVRDLRFTPAAGRRRRWWHGGRPVQHDDRALLARAAAMLGVPAAAPAIAA